MRFEGKVVVITGVGHRGQVGASLAQAFADDGASVIAIDRTPANVEARAAELRDAGHSALAFPCDLTDAAQVDAVARAIASSHNGRIDALVNTAGGFAMTGPVAESDPAAWQRQFDINLTTAYLTTRALLPLLRPTRGAIVYFASAAALPGARTKRMAAYAAAKSGVVTLMRTVAEEERDAGVRANAVAPTAIRTATNMESMGDTVRYVERDEVARVVTFLCSDAASAVTGQVVELSGMREAGSGKRNGS
ncbi:MAG TPA: SDR family NAD(P)-dependent oxidoreductase [Gemmatimonadaceae bacterium]|nr:SDR family NAD(P)-dependent oxidoreductase [Gemmatimonadaceae bacterium]